MQADKTSQPIPAAAVDPALVNGADATTAAQPTYEEPLPQGAAGGDTLVHDPLQEKAISYHEDDDTADDNAAPPPQNLDTYSGFHDATTSEPALLWTVEEETVLLHSSEASLKHIRTRLENLLLGVSHALRTRATRGESQERRESRGGSATRTRSRPSLDFADMVLAADHAVRRIVGEAFAAFEEDEVVQMVQLCSLADRGTGDCDELVRNAVVVLQALTHDGDAVRNVEQFRTFITQHRTEMSSEQWKHDYVTAMRSLAVGFLREPVAIMASYGSSMNQIVEHEALYIGLLRLCGGRPIGNTPLPKNLPATLDEAVLDLQQNAQTSKHGQSAASQQHQQRSPNANAAKGRSTPPKAKHSSSFIHTPKNSSKRTDTRRPSTSLHQPPQQESTMQSIEELQNAISVLMGGNTGSNPNSPPKKAKSRQDSTVALTASQVHELQKPISHNDSMIVSERRTEKPKPQYEPVPEVPQRLHLRNRGPTMSHY